MRGPRDINSVARIGSRRANRIVNCIVRLSKGSTAFSLITSLGTLMFRPTFCCRNVRTVRTVNLGCGALAMTGMSTSKGCSGSIPIMNRTAAVVPSLMTSCRMGPAMTGIPNSMGTCAFLHCSGGCAHSTTATPGMMGAGIAGNGTPGNVLAMGTRFASTSVGGVRGSRRMAMLTLRMDGKSAIIASSCTTIGTTCCGSLMLTTMSDVRTGSHRLFAATTRTVTSGRRIYGVI